MTNIYEPISVIDAINCLQTFLESDLWSMFKDDEINGSVYSREDKFENEKELWKYLEGHFNLLKKEIKRLTLQTPHGCENEQDDFQSTQGTRMMTEKLHDRKKTAVEQDNQHPVEKDLK